MAIDDIAGVLGLVAPIVSATAVYRLFIFLDGKASDAVNEAIIAWINGESYKRLDLRGAVISSFDHLYSTPLFRLKALFRSACFSAIAGAIFLLFKQVPPGSFAWGYLIYLLPIAVSDYLSLFVVRKCLGIANANIWITIIVAMSCAFIAIECTTFLFLLLWTAVAWSSSNVAYSGLFEFVMAMFYFDVIHPVEAMKSFAPALLVHLWLPLFLLCGAIKGGLHGLFRMTGFAQWFIKRGNEHPLDAIGITASALVFAGAALLKGISYFA